MAPSPRKLVITPPRASTSRSTNVWKSFSIPNIASMPSVSLSAVKPDRSMKITAASWCTGVSRKSGFLVSHFRSTGA